MYAAMEAVANHRGGGMDACPGHWRKVFSKVFRDNSINNA